jgi:hypothetical protein
VDVPLLVEPRCIIEDDIPWIIDLGVRRYPNNYDPTTTANWLRNQVLKNYITFYATRTQNAFQCSMLSLEPWLPSEPMCNVVAAVADDGHMWELVKLMRDSYAWACRRKCVWWAIRSDTSYDFEMLAKRLHATEVAPQYRRRCEPPR